MEMQQIRLLPTIEEGENMGRTSQMGCFQHQHPLLSSWWLSCPVRWSLRKLEGKRWIVQCENGRHADSSSEQMALCTSDHQASRKRAYGSQWAAGSTGPTGRTTLWGKHEPRPNKLQQPRLDYWGDQVCSQDHGTGSSFPKCPKVFHLIHLKCRYIIVCDWQNLFAIFVRSGLKQSQSCF